VLEDETAEDQDQAVAICARMYAEAHEEKAINAQVRKREADGEHPASHYLVVEDPEQVTTWHLRVRGVDGKPDHRLMGAAWAALHQGYRGNRYEGPGKQEAIRKLRALYEAEGMDVPAKAWEVAQVKARDGAPVLAGYGIVWGGQDLDGEHFTPDTDFWFDRLTETPMVLYQHGLDDAVMKSVVGQVVTKVPDDIGLWIEAQLDRAEKYREALLELADKGVLGWSSGSVGHLVDVDKGGAIRSWPVVEFSLTPTPCEPRTLGVQALRSLAETEPAVKALLPEADVTETSAASATEGDGEASVGKPEGSILKPTEVQTMAEKQEVQTLDTSALGEAITPAIVDAVLKALRDEEPLQKGGYSVEDALGKLEGSKSFGDWLLCVSRRDEKRMKAVYGSARKDTMVEQTGAEGGYLVPVEFLADLVAVGDPFSEVVYPRARKIPGNRRSIQIPVLDQTGAFAAYGKPNYYGGVLSYWTEEAAGKPSTEPDFKQLELVAHKLAGYTQASDELLADSAIALDALLRQLFGGAVRWRRDYAYLRGTGVGQPLGVLNSGALLTTARDVANQVSANDIHSLLAIFLPTSIGNAVWVINQTCMEFILALGDGTNYIWGPDATAAMPLRLYGIPVIWTEKTPALGTTGDVMLCDFSYYYIYDRSGLTIDVSQHYAFTSDLTTWRFVFRTDGQPCLSAPIYIDTTNQVSPFVALLNTTD